MLLMSEEVVRDDLDHSPGSIFKASRKRVFKALTETKQLGKVAQHSAGCSSLGAFNF